MKLYCGSTDQRNWGFNAHQGTVLCTVPAGLDPRRHFLWDQYRWLCPVGTRCGNMTSKPQQVLHDMHFSGCCMVYSPFGGGTS